MRLRIPKAKPLEKQVSNLINDTGTPPARGFAPSALVLNQGGFAPLNPHQKQQQTAKAKPVTRRGHIMAETNQPDWRAICRREYPGYAITGNGPFAVFGKVNLCVELFQSEIEARFTGKPVYELKPPVPRRPFRRINIDD